MAFDDPDRELPAGPVPARPAAPSESGRFWNELYWFVVLGAVAWIVGWIVIPPRALRSLSLLEKEQQLEQGLERARHVERVYENAIDAVENDPYYREGVYRQRLGVTRPGDEVLPAAPPDPAPTSPTASPGEP